MMDTSSSQMATPAPRTPLQILSGYTRVDSDRVATKIIGQAVFDSPASDANNLGKINDLVLDQNGQVAAVVIGVGGFLGIGESDVAVNFDQLKFVTEPMRTSSTTTTTPAAPAADGTRPANSTVGTTATTTTTTTAKASVNPDHAKLSATKEQLKAMPQFKYAK